MSTEAGLAWQARRWIRRNRRRALGAVAEVRERFASGTLRAATGNFR
jgi:hypothetical protein